MNAIHGTPVFDEWIMISMRPNGGNILCYEGPRAESYQRQFLRDIQPLRAGMADRTHATGDFDFQLQAPGTRYDACMRIGDAAWLVCNNTARTMTDICQEPRWKETQKVFVTLSEKVRVDPLA
ncbi:MAG: hypothetical protein PHQ04_10185 [Opitutaceae bacterium]|nr:hypothetical protein [Opitutaceae bacterium]